MSLISLGLVVFLCNLAPILAPPTWTVIVFFLITRELNPVATVIIAALCAGAGRYLLAIGTRALRNYIPEKARKNLFDAGLVFDSSQSRRYGLIALFIISPLPSAQLFEAAGLIGMRLIPLTLAFFSGRIVSYSLYVAGTTSLQERGLGDLIQNSMKSPWGIALQIALLFGIYLLTRIDWKKYLKH